jgi:hypothetical protein
VLLLALGVHSAACATITTSTRDEYEPLGVNTQVVAGRDWRIGGEWLTPSNVDDAALGVHVFRYQPCEKRVSERNLHVRTYERTNDEPELTGLALVAGLLGAGMVGWGIQRTADGESFTEKDPNDPKKPTPGQAVLLGSFLSLFLLRASVDMVRSIDGEDSWEEETSRTDPIVCERKDLANVKVALVSGDSILESTTAEAAGTAKFRATADAQGAALGILVNGERIGDLGPPPAHVSSEPAATPPTAASTPLTSPSRDVMGTWPKLPLAPSLTGARLLELPLKGLSRDVFERRMRDQGFVAGETSNSRQGFTLSGDVWHGLTQLLVLWDGDQHLIGMALTGEQTAEQAHSFKSQLDARFGVARSDASTPGRLVWDLGASVEAGYLVTGTSPGKQQVHFSITDLQAEQRVRKQIQDRAE